MALAEIIESDRNPLKREINKFLDDTWKGRDISLDTLLPIILIQKGKGKPLVYPVIKEWESESSTPFFRGFAEEGEKMDMRTLFMRDAQGLKLSVKTCLPHWKYSAADVNGIIFLNKKARLWNRLMGHWENESKYVQHIYDAGTVEDRFTHAKREIMIVTFAASDVITNDELHRFYAGKWIMGAVKHHYAESGGTSPFLGEVINR